MKKIVAFAGFSLLAVGAFAQTNLQVFYDFGKDRKYITSTLEMFIGKPESDTGFYAGLLRWFGYTHPFYAILYFFLIMV